jgi:uncharacterized protein (DUF302 family)
MVRNYKTSWSQSMSFNLHFTIHGDLEECINRVSDLLKSEGFGILTRINFHEKMKEKLNKEIPPTVILGACHPAMAFEAYNRHKDFLTLIPCNVVIREVEKGTYAIDMIKPAEMLKPLNDQELSQMASPFEEKFKNLFEKLP